MPSSRANLRIPRRAIEQWERVRAKLAEKIEARGQTADGARIFCEAAALLEAALGAGPGMIAEPYPHEKPARFAELLGPYDPDRKAADQRDLAQELRKIADRLERDNPTKETRRGRSGGLQQRHKSNHLLPDKERGSR